MLATYVLDYARYRTRHHILLDRDWSAAVAAMDHTSRPQGTETSSHILLSIFESRSSRARMSKHMSKHVSKHEPKRISIQPPERASGHVCGHVSKHNGYHALFSSFSAWMLCCRSTLLQLSECSDISPAARP